MINIVTSISILYATPTVIKYRSPWGTCGQHFKILYFLEFSTNVLSYASTVANVNPIILQGALADNDLIFHKLLHSLLGCQVVNQI